MVQSISQRGYISWYVLCGFLLFLGSIPPVFPLSSLSFSLPVNMVVQTTMSPQTLLKHFGAKVFQKGWILNREWGRQANNREINTYSFSTQIKGVGNPFKCWKPAVGTVVFSCLCFWCVALRHLLQLHISTIDIYRVSTEIYRLLICTIIIFIVVNIAGRIHVFCVSSPLWSFVANY